MQRRVPIGWWWGGASAAAMAVGAFGPWVKVSLPPLTRTVSGTDGDDGWIVAGAAALAAVALLVYLVRHRRWVPAVLLAAACAGGATAGYDLGTPNLVSSPVPFDEERQWGIYLSLIGSISLLLASLTLLFQTSEEADR